MNDPKKIVFIMFFLLAFSFFNIHPTAALGVSPARIVLEFIPDAVYEGQACFSPGGRSHLEIDTAGELGPYITLSEKELFIEGDKGCVDYKVNMPHSFDVPGVHEGLVRGTEVPEGGGMLVMRVMISHQVRVLVPYPGKYLEINYFRATNVEAGETVQFEAEVVSKGTEIINSASGTVFIYDKQKNLVGTVYTKTLKDLSNEEKGILYTTWDSGNYQKGNYEAVLIVNYDDQEANASSKLKLGGLDVEMINYTQEAYFGGFKPFYVLVESIWSEDIPNPRAVISVKNNMSEEIANFEVWAKNLPAWETAVLAGYIDTGATGIGYYDVNITLFYEGMTKEYSGKINITEEPAVVIPEENKPGFFSKLMTSKGSVKFLVIGLVVLLLITVSILIYVLIPKKKKNSPPQI